MRDTTPQVENPFQEFIFERIDQFAYESKRLRNRAPLLEYKALIDTFYFIGRRLGTLEHELALAKLSSEFALASSEAGDAWREIWSDFKEHRKRATETERSSAEKNRKAAENIANMEQSYAQFETEDEELRRSFLATIDAAIQVNAAGSGFVGFSRSDSWLFLRVNLKIFTVYLRYFFAKASFFIFRHVFILVTSFLILSIAYSEASKAMIEKLDSLVFPWPWIAAALTFCLFLLKKYYFDRKLKKWQIKLETQRLKPLLFHLHAVRTIALFLERLGKNRRMRPKSLSGHSS